MNIYLALIVTSSLNFSKGSIGRARKTCLITIVITAMSGVYYSEFFTLRNFKNAGFLKNQ